MYLLRGPRCLGVIIIAALTVPCVRETQGLLDQVNPSNLSNQSNRNRGDGGEREREDAGSPPQQSAPPSPRFDERHDERHDERRDDRHDARHDERHDECHMMMIYIYIYMYRPRAM